MRCSFLRFVFLGAALSLSACAVNNGSNLKPGVATLPEVIAAMGEPAMRWKDPDGQEQLAFTRGPEGTQTYMAFIGADGRLQSVEGVLDFAHFARIVPGKTTKNEVLRLLGPSYPEWTTYSKANDQLVWEWNVCNSQRQVARFDVYFDATSGVVRTTDQRTLFVGFRGVEMGC